MSWFFSAFCLPHECAHNIAILEENITLTYQDLEQKVKQCALNLEKQGVFAGSRVAFIAGITVSSIISLLALFLLKATPCLLSTRLPKEMIRPLLEKARVSFFLDIDCYIVQKIASIKPLPEAILLFTSGSTGEPKLACLHFSHFLESALGAAPFFELDKNPGKWLLSLPLFHVSGLSILFRCLSSGSCILLTPLLSKSSIEATHLSCVPTQLIKILDNNIKFPHLHSLLLGGAPIADSLLQKALSQSIPVKTTYGLTETASLVTLSSSANHLGKALPGRELMIDKTGEIHVKGQTLFSGYEIANSLKLTLTHDGWFATGDLGSFTKEGNLLYKGRKDNLFISGGENIYPEEIEKVLNTLPGVISSVVVPVDDTLFGKRPVAFLDMSLPLPSTDSLFEALAKKLPKFCIPIQFHPFPEELKNEIKIKRKSFFNIIKTK